MLRLYSILKSAYLVGFCALLCASSGIKADLYKMYGLNFSPYLEGQSPDQGSQISADQIRARMAIVAPNTGWIRTYSCANGQEDTGRIAHSMGLKVAMGAWLGRDLTANEREITNLIHAIQEGQVDLAIVGSETLLRHDLSEAQLLDYINRVKQQASGVPVTSADVYSQLLQHPALLTACNVILANFYPYWEGVAVEHGIAALHQQYAQLIAVSKGKSVIISETGWPSAGNTIGDAVPSPDNASYYFMDFVSWARANNVAYFYFSAFDETWKAATEGPQGAHWGIWDKNGSLKVGMQQVFDGVTLPDHWSGTMLTDGPGTPRIDFTYVPDYGSFGQLKGQVLHVRPIDWSVAVYIYVGGGWWTKPTFDLPLTFIWPDGDWQCNITTGGSDQNATLIAAYLVPKNYSPPLMSGQTLLPSELDQNAVAKQVFARKVAATVSGTITLPGCINSAQPITFTLRPWDGTGNFTRVQTLSATGTFRLTGLPRATYILHIKGDKWLAANIPMDTSRGDVAELSATLNPGDLNNDNAVELEDLSLFFDAYGSTPGNPNWNANADLSCDDVVELDDLALFFDNYGGSGDP